MTDTTPIQDGASKEPQLRLVVGFGVVFLSLMLALAIFVPNPTEFQAFVFRVTLALAAGAVGAVIPGFFQIEGQALRFTLRASGALAVFVLIYTINPPSLIVEAKLGEEPKSPPPTVASPAVEKSSGDPGAGERTAKHPQGPEQQEDLPQPIHQNGTGAVDQTAVTSALRDNPQVPEARPAHPSDASVEEQSDGLPSEWVRTIDMELHVSRFAVAPGACPTPVARGNWAGGERGIVLRCSGDWVVFDVKPLLQNGAMHVDSFYCLRLENAHGEHLSLRSDAFPRWQSRTYFADGQNIGFKVNESDIVITHDNSRRQPFDSRCTF